jgi:hypothetical protein
MSISILKSRKDMPGAPGNEAGTPSIVIKSTTPPDYFGSHASSFASASASQVPSPWCGSPQRATGHNPSALAVTTEALQSEEAVLSSGGSVLGQRVTWDCITPNKRIVNA